MWNNDYESDDNGNNEDDIYNAEEISTTKYNIILCELYNRNIHGIPPLSSNVDNHYLVIYRFKSFNKTLIKNISNDISTAYAYLDDQTHPIFKNYKYIMSQPDYIKPEIAECIYLEGDEFVAIIKTFWIKIIQRKWKKIYREQKNIIKKRMIYSSIIYKELKGKWPKDCFHYPTIRGMLGKVL